MLTIFKRSTFDLRGYRIIGNWLQGGRRRERVVKRKRGKNGNPSSMRKRRRKRKAGAGEERERNHESYWRAEKVDYTGIR